MLPSMRKAITLTLSIALLGIFAAVVVAAVGPSDGTSTLPASSTRTTDATTDRTTTSQDNAGVDISGPCDESDHANDPRCAGVNVPAAPAPAQSGVDISGPCDEAEHANDPRCTGVGLGDDGRVDNSGPGNGDDIDDDSSSSGSGGGGNSGPGGGDDD
jgi:uncharacterized membrane protein YgcG